MYRRWLWPAFALPGLVWLTLLFVVPFYTVLSVALGTVDPILFQPVPIWNPADWNAGWLIEVLERLSPGGPDEGAPPRAHHPAALDQLHDANAGVGEPPRRRRLRQPVPHLHQHPERAARLARRPLLDRDPRAGLRLHPILHPALVRGPRPHRSKPSRGRPRPRREPPGDVPHRHAATLENRGPRRRGPDCAPHVRRLL